MNKKRRKRLAIWLGLGGGVLLILLIVCNVVGKKSGAPEVSVMKLEPGRIVSTVSGTGELRSANQVDISAEMVSRVRKIYVKEGEQVKKGQVLCVLDDISARSTRNLNKANFDEASAAYERGKVLYKEDLISEAEFERLRTAYEVTLSQLQQSQDKLDKTRIYAPIPGRVVALNVEEGETVMMGTMNNPGTVIITIADLDAMQARIDVDESDVVDLKIGQRANVRLDAMPDTTFLAEVYTISYMPNPSNLASTAEGVTDFEVILNLTDADPAHRPGMSVSADIVTARRDSVVVCPLQAVGRREIADQVAETVFILENGQAILKTIRTGISDGRSVEILDGLEEGQTVITGPYKILRTLQDSSKVKVSKEGEGQWQQQEGRRRPGVRVRVRT